APGEAERQGFREGSELRSGFAAFAPAEQQAGDKTLDEEADEGCNGPEPGDLAQGPVRDDEAENEGDDEDGQDNRRDVDEGVKPAATRDDPRQDPPGAVKGNGRYEDRTQDHGEKGAERVPAGVE